ncbi:MAG: hypothetical protein K2Y32_10425 [Candidatus Obscuribacterales bacterium]|nr:hypothetical protein [Candidatus Obscuribacterales bacterium]
MENGALKLLFLLLAFVLACLSFRSLRRNTKKSSVKPKVEVEEPKTPPPSANSPAATAAAESDQPSLPDALLPENYFQPLDEMPIERKALYFGINHFETLKDSAYGALTEDSLRAAYMKCPVADERLCLIYLLKQLPQFGTVLDTKESVSYVSGNGWAMPIRFQKSVYGFNRQVLLALLNSQSKPATA